MLMDTGGRFPHQLRCEYIGQPPGTQLTSKTPLEFQWRVCGTEIDFVREVKTKWNNLQQRGVPRPAEWHALLRAMVLPILAQEAASNAKKRYSGGDVDCAFLGIPKNVSLVDGTQ